MNKLRFILIAALLILGSGVAHACDYLSIDIGRSQLANKDKIWHDFEPTVSAGYSSTDQEYSNAWGIGCGYSYPWGLVEIAYQDFGDTKSFAGYPYDPGTPGSSPGGCYWPCTPTQWVYHWGTARGVTTKAIWEHMFTDEFGVVGILGVTAYYAKFKYTIANEAGNPFQRTFSTQKDFDSTGMSLMWGAGVVYDKLLIKFERYESIAAKNKQENGKGSFQQINLVSASYQIPIRIFR